MRHCKRATAPLGDQMRFQLSNARFATLCCQFPAPPAKESEDIRVEGAMH
jgi:hypothetical protein